MSMIDEGVQLESLLDLGLTWGPGQLLAASGLSGPTRYEQGLVARSRQDADFDVVLPVEGRVTLDDAPPRRALIAGDYFVLELQDGGLACGVMLDAEHLLIEAPAVRVSDGLRVSRSGGRSLISAPKASSPESPGRSVMDLIALRHHWFVEHAEHLRRKIGRDLDPVARKALLQLRTQVQSPEGMLGKRWSTPDRWPHRDMWLWDSVFHALGWRHLDLPLAQEVIEAVFEAQQSDGFVPHQASPTARSTITQPPILAFGVLQLLRSGADPDWCRTLYQPLQDYLRWNRQHRDRDGSGLLEWFIEEDENCRSGESGMDNSPRFDEAIQLDAVDFNAFMAAEYHALQQLAQRLGHDRDAQTFATQRQQLADLINQRMWDPATGFYHDYDAARGARTPILSSAGFMPLLAGIASPAQAQRLAEHLQNPQTFGTPLPVPSVAARCQPPHNKDMWRGPVWVNINWLIVHALREHGFDPLAADLRDRTLAAVEKQVRRLGVFFEYYDDSDAVTPPQLLRKSSTQRGINPYHEVIYEFGWTASLYLDLLVDAASSPSA